MLFSLFKRTQKRNIRQDRSQNNNPVDQYNTVGEIVFFDLWCDIYYKLLIYFILLSRSSPNAQIRVPQFIIDYLSRCISSPPENRLQVEYFLPQREELRRLMLESLYRRALLPLEENESTFDSSNVSTTK